jgi:hypothetical protein
MSKSLPSLEKKRGGGMSNRERMEREEEEQRKRKEQQQQLPAIVKQETKADDAAKPPPPQPLNEIVIELPDGRKAEINRDTKMMVLDAWHACETGVLDYAVLAKWFIDSGRSNEWFRSVIEHRHREYYYQMPDGTKVFPLADRRSEGLVSPFERLSKAIAREGRRQFDQLAFSVSRPPPQLRAKQSDQSIEDEKQKKLLKEQKAEYSRLFKQAVTARKQDIEDHPILSARAKLIEKRSRGQIGIQNLPSKYGTSGQVDNEQEEEAPSHGIRVDSLSDYYGTGEEEQETY